MTNEKKPGANFCGNILAKMAYEITRSIMRARIDLRNNGSDGNDLMFDEISDTDCQVMTPKWFGKAGIGYMLKSIRGKMRISFKCVRDGILNIWLRSDIYVDSSDRKIPVWIDYDYFAINGKVIFDKNTAVWHDEAFRIDKQVYDGEKIVLDISWRPHAYETLQLQEIVRLLQQKLLVKILAPPQCTDVCAFDDEKNSKISFSILGICVSRDIVGAAGFKVNRFVQDVSPVSLFYGSMLGDGFKFDEDNIKKYLVNPKLQRFFITNTILDMNKTVYKRMFEVKSDWLMIDAGCLRHRTLIDKNRNAAVTEAHLRRLKYSYDENVCQMVGTMDLNDTEFEACMDAFIKNILKKYEERKIIVAEYYLVPDYVDRDRIGIHRLKEDMEPANSALRRGYNYMKKNMRQAHFIPFPNHTLADAGNKWGLTALHYVPEYYEYGREVLETIMKNLTYEEEEHRIGMLKNFYQKKMQYAYFY